MVMVEYINISSLHRVCIPIRPITDKHHEGITFFYIGQYPFRNHILGTELLESPVGMEFSTGSFLWSNPGDCS